MGGTEATGSGMPRRKLERIRFGEFLLEKKLLSDEQLIAALAEHWSNGGKIGAAISRAGFLPPEEIERQAALYHGLDVIEI
ncbi:MAG TPA: hypothetical protein VFU21_32880 [Kofleriaceae bacterium]|nr:hypothetical protein [Kofleriaceae bacterium]